MTAIDEPRTRQAPPTRPAKPDRRPVPGASPQTPAPSALARGFGPFLVLAALRLLESFRPSRGRRAAGGRASAGRLLGVMVAALAIAALINADAMVERAQRKPIGAARDRSLAIWHPVQDVAHVLQLHRLRDLGDAVVGDDARPAAPTPVTAPDRPVVAAPPVRPELRTPTAAAPLRLWVGGDSMMRDLSESVERLAADDPLLASTVHYEISSGLARPDYFDWPATLAADMAATDAEVVVIMFGANDGQGLIASDGTVFQQVTDAGWQREYGVRAAAVMDQLRAEDRLVLWVLQPPMRDADFDARIDIINDLYRDAAADRPWIELVETAPLFGDGNGAFADRLAGPDGELEDLRQDDGIHFARAGADRLAAHLLQLVDDEFERSPATAMTTSTTEPG